MKIYVVGSTVFMNKMIDIKNEIVKLGFDGWIHKDYEEYVSGESKDLERWKDSSERAALKIENDYFKVHYKNILASDAILVVNDKKNEIENYIGGNALIEMGQAYVNDKKIFLLNNLPKGLSYDDEIVAMQPLCLNGDLKKLKLQD